MTTNTNQPTDLAALAQSLYPGEGGTQEARFAADPAIEALYASPQAQRQQQQQRTTPAPQRSAAQQQQQETAPRSEADRARSMYPEEAAADRAREQAEAGQQQRAPIEVRAPEGMELDGEFTKTYGTVASELGISPEAAQGLVDKMIPAMQAQHAARLDAAQQQWEASLAEHPDVDLPYARAALERYGSPELRALLQESRLASHPEIVALLSRVGASMMQGRFGRY